MLLPVVLTILLQSPTVMQSMAQGIPVLGKLIYSGGPIPLGVEISLEGEDGQVLDRRTAMPGGEFRFDNVRLGRYWVVVEGERFENVRERLDIDIRTFGSASITINLKLRPGLDLGSGESVVTADMLKRKIPKEALREFEKSLEQKQRKQPVKEIGHLQKAVTLAPDFFEAHHALGQALAKAQRGPEAIKALEKAIELNKASVPARALLGRLLVESNEFDKGADVLDEAIRLGNAPAESYFFLGLALYKLGELEDAEFNLQNAINMAPDASGPSHLQLFNVYMKSRQGKKALEQLDLFLSKFPNSPMVPQIQDQAAKLRQSLQR